VKSSISIKTIVSKILRILREGFRDLERRKKLNGIFYYKTLKKKKSFVIEVISRGLKINFLIGDSITNFRELFNPQKFL